MGSQGKGMQEREGDVGQRMFTMADMKEFAAALVKEVAEATRPKPSALLSDDEIMSKFRQDLNRQALPETRVKCRSSETRSTFTARIDHRGLVVELEEYELPTDWERRVPSNYPRFKNGKGGDETTMFKHWKATTFWVPDGQRFLAKPLPVHVRLDMAEKIDRLEAQAVAEQQAALQADADRIATEGQTTASAE